MSVEPGLEAGTSVAKLLATDRDSGELGRVSYSLSADTPAPARPCFSVAPDSGEVKVAQPLEEADTPLLPLRLVVSALCTVSCTVLYYTHITGGCHG